jgi:hypothetical protein
MVRCTDCGFLCVLKIANSEELTAVPKGVRENWAEPQGSLRGFWSGNATAGVCFVQALPEEEMRQARTGLKESEHIVNRDRECASFMRWQQGFSPKEHLELLQIKKQSEFQEERRRGDLEFQEQVRKDDRAFQEEVREREAERQKSQREDDRKWQLDRQDKEKWSARWWALLMLALGTALGIFSTMITTLLQGKK